MRKIRKFHLKKFGGESPGNLTLAITDRIGATGGAGALPATFNFAVNNAQLVGLRTVQWDFVSECSAVALRVRGDKKGPFAETCFLCSFSFH
jgi:hypothetical protein